jgi:predicted nucleic acid-binding protein
MEQNGKVHRLGHQDCGPLKNRIHALALEKPSGQRIMRKDAHLIAAAQAADRVIVTLDHVARDLFKEHAERLKTPQGIQWRNPEEEPVPWA